jgi:tuftelin-interacting protein 11
MFAAWEPFDVSSDVLLSTLIPWRHAFRLSTSDADTNQHQGRGMTAWESLLWSLWLPKVRSTIK